MSKDKKKYPWIKSIFKRKDPEPVECVYAGPEYFQNRNGQAADEKADPASDNVESAPVYAGPEYFDGKDGGDRIMEDVYAGPEFFEKQSADPAEEIEEPEEQSDADAPSDEGFDEKDEKTIEIEDKQIMQAVYAAPEIYPQKFQAEQDPRMFMMAYAAPPLINNDAPMFMAAYAGPEMMSGVYSGPAPGAWLDPNAGKNNECVPLDPKALNGFALVKCPVCGYEIEADKKFCSECGSTIDKTGVRHGKCPGCGSEVDSETKYCPECGMPVKFGD